MVSYYKILSLVGTVLNVPQLNHILFMKPFTVMIINFSDKATDRVYKPSYRNRLFLGPENFLQQ